jgi:hypothetical protein
MEEIKLNDDIIDQIKDFKSWRATKEQKLLIDELILNKELREFYKKYGLCENCNQPKNNRYWCRICSKFYLKNYHFVMNPIFQSRLFLLL